MTGHENFTRREEVKTSSNRAFGLVFATVFALIGLLPLVGGEQPRTWSLLLSVAFLGVALALPSLLSPLNQLWTKFGLLLHRVVSPIIMGLILYLVFTPIGVLLRLLGKDPLRLRLQPDADSYWIEREPPGPAPETMANPF